MRRFFVKNILFILTINILVKTIWVFFIDRTVQNRVGHASYGTYAPLLSFSIIFAILLDFGLTNYNSRTISRQPDKLARLFPDMLSARVVLMLLYMLVAGTIGYVAGYRGWELLLLFGVLLIQTLNSLLLFIRSNVAALQRFKTDGILSISDRLILIFLCGFLLYYPTTAKNFKIEWFIGTQIISYFLACVIAFMVLGSIHKVQLRFSFHPKKILDIIKSTFPYALLIFLMSIYIRSDMNLVEWLCGSKGKDQAGIYAASYRLLDYCIQYAGMFATMLLPFFGRLLSQKQDVQPIIKLCVNMLLPVSFMIAVAAIFFGSDIMHVLYKDASGYDGVIFAWLMACFPCWCITYVYSTLLTANGNLRQLNKIAFAGVVLNIGLNLVLIPRYMALGAAITAFVTQVFVAFAFAFYAGNLLKLPINVKWILAHLGFFILILLAGFAATIPSIHFMAALILFGGVCLLLMFLFRFISVKNIRQLIVRD
jgi:O-antigen/teichoic acid export membrane protein